ncbi:MAG: hypothetical protein N2749_07210 [Clostridia bacterium]|nr:hypothetical protein [Clostridia bacterium]
MNKKELEVVVARLGYLPGGSKQAAIIVNNAIKEFSLKDEGDSTITLSHDEIEALKTLVAAAFQNSDMVPERWYCDSDCTRARELFCTGMLSIDKRSNRRCPYIHDESLK